MLSVQLKSSFKVPNVDSKSVPDDVDPFKLATKIGQTYIFQNNNVYNK